MAQEQKQELMLVRNHLGRGGALCKEFNRVRLVENLDWRVEQAYALEIIDGSEQLKRCTPESIGRALIDGAVMGLSLSPAKREAYLIPYRVKVGRDRWEDKASLSPSYMGLEQIAYRTGFIEMIQCGVARNGDKTRVWTDDEGRHVEVIEGQTERGDVKFAYCITSLTSGKQHVEVMDRAALMACRDAAAKKNNGKVPATWTGPFREEMYKKAVLRRAWKHLPRVTNPKIAAMMEAVDRTDPMDFTTDDNVVEETLTINQNEIGVLVETMRDGGVPERGFDAWLQALAKSCGYQSIRAVRSQDFERVKTLLKEGLERWKAQRSSTSDASGSTPDASTPREEAA